MPSGDTVEDRRTRNRLIRQFYFQWMGKHEERKVFNTSLNDFIYIKYISVNETAGYASLRYLSTLAVLQLDAILPNAILKDSKPVNPKTKNQKGFKRMLIMEYNCPAIGLVRLTVGQKGSDGSKVQYCITAIFSSRAFDIPMALIGYAALSVDRHMTHFTPQSIATSRTLSVPITLVLTASIGKNSHDGTCLRAAAWNI